MKVKVFLRNRDGSVYAEGVYDGTQLEILPGGTIKKEFANHILGGKKALSYRNNKNYVDENFKILKKCVFSSPSTAAQFVLGNSSNGYRSWKTKDGQTLGDYLKSNGLK